MKNRTRERGPRNTCALRWRLLPLMIAGCFGQAAWANPLGAQVVSGQAGFQQQGSVLSVTNSPGAIINWQSFSIGRGELTRFIQQSADSTVLNRVVGQDPSKILGTLQSNGKVFLINPNGILFGQGARVDVNGLVASTLDIGNDDFLKGKMNFAGAGAAGAVVNQGEIRTPDGGLVYLIAPNVENSGIIHSPKGDVLLAAGHTVQLADTSNPNLQVVVSAPDNEALNLGQIITGGGRTGIYGALVRQRGVVSADSAVVGENGRIVFKASREATLEAGSVTTATGVGKGGEVQVLGEQVALTGDARIDVSGQTGGGTVLVGGDYKGSNPLVRNAKRTSMSSAASIRVDAGVTGDGGKVILWGDDSTSVHGTISARGGSVSGNGGFIETSAAHLDVSGIRIDARAPGGKSGTWLLDPNNVMVTDTPGTDTDYSYFRPVDLQNAGADVDLYATHDIEIRSAVNLSTPGTHFDAWAGRNIEVLASVTTSGGGVYLHGGDTVNVRAPIRSNGGDISLSGANVNVATTALGGIVDSASGDIYITATNKIVNEGNITADDTITLKSDRMTLQGGSIRTTGADGTVNLETYEYGSAVELGATNATDEATGLLQLKDEELDTIRTGTLRITADGDIRINQAISVDGVSRALSLTSYYGDIAQGGGATIAAPALAVSAGNVDLQAENGVGVFAAQVQRDLWFRTANQLTVSSVDGIDGIERYAFPTELAGSEAASCSAPGIIHLHSAMGINQTDRGRIDTGGATLLLDAAGSIQLGGWGNYLGSVAAKAGGSVEIASEQDLRVSGDRGINGITAGGDVRLRAGFDSLLSVDADINAGAAHVDLIADRLALNATVTADEASIRPFWYGRSITVGDANCAVADCLSITNLHRVAARIIGIGRDPLDYDYEPYIDGSDYGYGYGYGYAGPIHVAGITNTGTGALTDRNSATRLIGLLSGEGVTQSGGIDVEGLGIIAGGDVKLDHAGNRVSRVFGASMDGNFSFSNVGPLTIGAPLGLDVDYDTMGIWAPNGEIHVSNVGHLQVASNATVLTDSGAIRLTAHSPLTVNGAVTSATGAIALEAANSGSPQDVLTINGTVTTGGQTDLRAGAKIVINGMVKSANLNQTGTPVVTPPPPPSSPPPPANNVTRQAASTVVSTIVRATQAATNLVPVSDERDTAGDKDEKKEKTAAAVKEDGAKKNDPGKKLYCN